MLVICGGALAIGAAASLAMPFAPFALALVFAVAVGAVWAALQGMGAGQLFLSALAILVSTQVGYGLGLVGAAAGHGARGWLKRPSPAKPVPSSLPDMHVGEKP